MKKRREAEAQSKGRAVVETTTKPTTGATDTSRSRFDYVQKECKELLDTLGITTITSYGEAEAGCASLNRLNLVDGCVTVDGDVFLYGAKKVFRNLSTDTNNFVCQEFAMSKIESSLNLSRDKMIVMAIIFGCDYLPEGLNSVNKECIVKLLASWPSGQAVKVLEEWIETEITEEAPPPRPAHCSICKHPGTLRSHSKSGCSFCNSTTGCVNAEKPCECVWHKNELRYEEYNLRDKLRSLSSATVLDIFEEFQKEPPEEWKNLAISPWRMPQISKFVEITTRKLKWEVSYAVTKILPLVTRWVVIHGRNFLDRGGELDLFPVRIIRKRVKRGCPMYEVEWKFKKETTGFPSEFVSLEPQFLIVQNHQDLLGPSLTKPLKTKNVRKKRKPKAGKRDEGMRSNDIAEMLERMAITKQKEAPQATGSNESLLALESDADSDLSDIVDLICNRRSKPLIAEQQAVTIQSDDTPFCKPKILSLLPGENNKSGNREESKSVVDKETGSNFSFDFTLSELLRSKNSTMVEEFKETESVSCSPTRDSKDFSGNSDLFCTPKPLAERLYHFAKDSP